MAATMLNMPALAFRTRNNSGGSTGSSVSSLDSSIGNDHLAIAAAAANSSPLQAADLQTIANLLSLNKQQQQQTVPITPPVHQTAAMQQVINAQLAAAAATTTPATTEQLTKTLGSSNGSTRYKTELCRSFTETGFCKYGDKCQFAHGNFEIKAMPRHPKYKSDLCRTFHTTGLCPYGPRCHFIHSEDESKLTEINLMKQQAAARQATQQMLQQAGRLRAQQQALQAQMQALMISQVHLQIAQKQLGSNPTTPTIPPTPTTPAQQNKPVFFPQLSVPTHQQQTIQQQLTAEKIAALQRTMSMPASAATTNPVFHNNAAVAAAATNNNLHLINNGMVGSTMDTPPITPPCGSPTFDNTASNNRNDVFTNTMIPSPTSSVSSRSSLSSVSSIGSSVSSSGKVVSPPPGFAPKSELSSAESQKPKSALNLDFDFENRMNNFDSQMSEVVSRLHNVDLESVSSFEMYTPSQSPDSFVNSPLDSPRSGSSMGSRLPVFSQFS